MLKIMMACAGALFLTAVSVGDAAAQSASCRARCDRDHGAHPGRYSACVNQCPRVRTQQRQQQPSRGASCRARCERDHGAHPGRESACKSGCPR